MDITSGHTSQLDINAIGIVAMDFDWRDQYVYWSEVTSSSSLIKRKCLDPNIALKVSLPLFGSFTIAFYMLLSMFSNFVCCENIACLIR